MKIHSDTLTLNDLHRALPKGVLMHCTQKGSRTRSHAFDVTLYVWEKDSLHRRFGNSGGYGAKDEVAATWDEWGIWIANLYAADPDAVMAYYKDHADFIAETTRTIENVRRRHKPTSVEARTHTAPWLTAVPA